MNLYFCGRPVEVRGDCDDGWLWGLEHGAKKWCWYWARQLKATLSEPWYDKPARWNPAS